MERQNWKGTYMQKLFSKNLQLALKISKLSFSEHIVEY